MKDRVLKTCNRLNSETIQSAVSSLIELHHCINVNGYQFEHLIYGNDNCSITNKIMVIID